MAQTMIQIVRELQSRGHVVDFYVRKDGGILIRQIDSERFSGASGNARARQMAGVEISEARSKQLKYATRSRKSIRNIPDDAVRERYREVKKKWNKAFKSKGGKPHPAGYFGWKRIQYAYKHYGREEALRRISEAEKYSSGIAYSKNVQILAGFIRMAGNQYRSPELLKLADDLEANAYLIKDEWIKPAYDRLYDLNKNPDPKQIASDVRRILRL